MNTSAKTSLVLIATLACYSTMVPMDNRLRLLNDPNHYRHQTRHLSLSNGSVVSTGYRYPNFNNAKLPVIRNLHSNIVMIGYPGNFYFEPTNVLYKVQKEEQILPNNIIRTTWSFEPVNNPRS